MDKSSLKKALLEAKEIEKVAYESAKKTLEEAITPQIDKAVKETLMELEKELSVEPAVEAETTTKEKVSEGVKIEVQPGANIKVNVENNGETTITADINTSVEKTEETPNTNTTMDMEDRANDEIYEVVDISEEDEVPTTKTSTEPPAPEPTSTLENPFEVINQKLDSILQKVSAETEESPSAEGEVEIVDDEAVTKSTPETPTPETQAAKTTSTETKSKELVGEASDEDTVYELSDEMEDDEFVREADAEEDVCEMDDMEEIEIVDEDEDGELEEAGTSSAFSAQRGAGRRRGYAPIQGAKTVGEPGHHAPEGYWSQASLRENEQKKIKAQYESELDELKQENESLRKTIKEYKDAFVVLRKQINEVQVFNAKLAFANKLFIKGGLTNDEKIKIAEEFDKADTVEDAKKLYNKLLKEIASGKTTKTAPEEKLKSMKPSIQSAQAQQTQSQTLYESDEIRRMKKLAGILKHTEE